MAQSEIKIIRYNGGVIYHDLKFNTFTAQFKDQARRCMGLSGCKQSVTNMKTAYNKTLVETRRLIRLKGYMHP